MVCAYDYLPQELIGTEKIRYSNSMRHKTRACTKKEKDGTSNQVLQQA
jgi:hypothetical protein